jgi:hypothetical protein
MHHKNCGFDNEITVYLAAGDKKTSESTHYSLASKRCIKLG